VGLGYDDGFGAFPDPAPAPPPADAPVEAQEVLLRSYDGDLGSQLRLFAETVQWVAGVADTTKFPHSAICKVEIWKSGSLQGWATAFYVGRRMLMTNAHVVNDGDTFVIIPGKNGAGQTRAEEPFGRFTCTQARAHERYSPSGGHSRDFDMAVIHATQDAPGGKWLTPIEELRQSRPEGVGVCGYSARSRRADLPGRIVNATLNPDRQHVHRGFVRGLTDESFSYDVQELAGSSGSPVYWIEAGTPPRAHVVGINAGPRDDTTNEGCRFTDAKVAWIRARAAEWHETAAMALDEESGGDAPVEAMELLEQSVDGTLEGQVRLFAQSTQWIAGVADTHNFPHSAICFVADVARGPEAEAGTAFFIGRHLLLTAGHVVDGKTRLGFVPGKNGQGTDAAHEPFGRFEVALTASNCFKYPGYAQATGTDMALVYTGPTNSAPGGHWFNLLEELRQSRPEGVGVCGYSQRSRHTGWLPALVNAINDSRKQHLHRGYVRDLPGSGLFTYDVQTLPGASGSPVYWVQTGALPTIHVVGVHISLQDGTTNRGCRLTDEKVAWLRAKAAQFGESNAFALGDDGGQFDYAQAQAAAPATARTTGATPRLAPPPAPVMQQPLGLDVALAGPAAAVEIATTVLGAVMERLNSRNGDIELQLDQMRGLKHPNDRPPAQPRPVQDGPAIRLVDWPKVENLLSDTISAGLEIRWQFDGVSLGNVQVSAIRTNDALGWGLRVTAHIMDDNIVYPSTQPTFAALRVRVEYTFSRPVGSDILAFQEVHLFGNGRYNVGGDWTQYRSLPLECTDTPEEHADPQLVKSVPVAQALEVAERSVAPTAPSRFLAAALQASSGVRRQVLTIAARELGVREKPNPGYQGPNTHTGDPTINDDVEGRIVAYLTDSGVGAAAGRDNPAYCAAFSMFVLRHAGFTGVRGSASASALRAQFEQAGRFHGVAQDRPYDPARDGRPQPGDLFFTGPYGREGHVGIVVGVDDNGTLHTLEGNTWGPVETNAGVMERDHPAARHAARFALTGFGSLN
jgi:V8-like Glu-specific endopeptidase